MMKKSLTIIDLFNSSCDILHIDNRKFSDSEKVFISNLAFSNFFNLITSRGQPYVFAQMIQQTVKSRDTQFLELDTFDNFTILLEIFTCNDFTKNAKIIKLQQQPSSKAIILNGYTLFGNKLYFNCEYDNLVIYYVPNPYFELNDKIKFPYESNIDYLSLMIQLEIAKKHRDSNLLQFLTNQIVDLSNMVVLRMQNYKDLASNPLLNYYGK